MFDTEQLIDFMEEKFGVRIDKERLVEEAIQLYLTELDEEIIPPSIHNYLPDPVTVQTYSYIDESEWIIGIALEAETNNPLFLVCLKDGEKVFQELLI